jgi:hypothetical protein
MKRRRLLYGLGLATVGSSATALTGATLSNTVSPAADFRVKVDAGLLVEAGVMFEERDIGPEETKAGQGKNNFYSDSDGKKVFFTQDSNFSLEGTDAAFQSGIEAIQSDTTGVITRCSLSTTPMPPISHCNSPREFRTSKEATMSIFGMQFR